ncbi:MAG: TetR/AcrR family transcriptional regulator [Actinomycetota bacterium]
MADNARHELRRRPNQQRSRERVADICQATMRLIGERGADEVTMSDIAAASEMSNSALYRYFPTKQAIIKQLAVERYDELRARAAAEAEPGVDPRQRLLAGLRAYIAEHQADPYLARLRAAVRASPDLSPLDLDDSLANARVITERIREVDPSLADPTLERRVLLVFELLDAIIHLACRTAPNDAVTLIDDFIDIADHHIFGKAAEPGRAGNAS